MRRVIRDEKRPERDSGGAARGSSGASLGVLPACTRRASPMLAPGAPKDPRGVRGVCADGHACHTGAAGATAATAAVAGAGTLTGGMETESGGGVSASGVRPQRYSSMPDAWKATARTASSSSSSSSGAALGRGGTPRTHGSAAVVARSGAVRASGGSVRGAVLLLLLLPSADRRRPFIATPVPCGPRTDGEGGRGVRQQAEGKGPKTHPRFCAGRATERDTPAIVT